MALAVTGHGFGHAVRSAEVARALLDAGARVFVRTDAPAWLFPAGADVLPSSGCPIDVGVVQRDGLELDVDATRQRWMELGATFEQHVAREADLLRRAGADVLVGDIPPLAFAAAARAGIPSAAVGNFSWDWIYAGWPGFDGTVSQIRAAYCQANVLLRLPLHSKEPDAFGAFRDVEDVPLIARTSTQPRSAVRAALGIPARATVALLSFGGFDAANLDLDALGAWAQYQFVLTPAQHELAQTAVPPNVRLLPREQTDYVSLLAACDAVVTKPGYGIAADALANRVPVLYTDRGPFREYPVLAAALESLGPARYVPQPEVRAGRLGPHLDALLALPRTWAPLRLDGAHQVAARALRLAGDHIHLARHAPC